MKRLIVLSHRRFSHTWFSATRSWVLAPLASNSHILLKVDFLALGSSVTSFLFLLRALTLLIVRCHWRLQYQDDVNSFLNSNVISSNYNHSDFCDMIIETSCASHSVLIQNASFISASTPSSYNNSDLEFRRLHFLNVLILLSNLNLN